jgi:hypothetical protein
VFVPIEKKKLNKPHAHLSFKLVWAFCVSSQLWLAWLLSLLMWLLFCLCASFYKCKDFSMQFHLLSELGYKRPLVLSVARRKLVLKLCL